MGSGGLTAAAVLDPLHLFHQEQPSYQEQQLQNMQLAETTQQYTTQQELMPFELQNMGLIRDPSTGQLRRMTEAEQEANMSPLELKQYQLENTLLDQQQQAAAGTLPLPDWLQGDLNTARTASDEGIARAYGPNASASTAGIQAKTAQDLSESKIKSAYMTGQQALGSQLYGQYTGLSDTMNQQSLSNYGAFENQGSGLIQNLAMTAAPYAQGRQQANAQASNLVGSIASLIGSLYGGGMLSGRNNQQTSSPSYTTSGDIRGDQSSNTASYYRNLFGNP